MSRRVFFSFHYQDVIDFRANVVRNHWVTKLNREDAGFFDASLWERKKLEGNRSIKRLIDDGLSNTSVTCVLIGDKTFERPWVRYEILKSFMRGNKLFGVHINSIVDRNQRTKQPLGKNPFDFLGITYAEDGRSFTLHEYIDGVWHEYQEIENKSTFEIEPVQESYRGQGYKLGRFYSVYDWVKNDGYNNFSKWVES